ncbi:hypothetical protein Tco_0602984, partial [Tanacetum coccineum]
RRTKHKMESSSEGTGTTSGVPDELSGKAKVLDEGAGITPEVLDETKDKSDEEVDSEDWGSTDDKDLILKEDKENVDIEKTDEEETDSDDDEKEVKKDEMPEERKVDEEQKEKELHKGMEQPTNEHVEVPVSATQQERPTLLQSTSSHLISSNFDNQFINSSNASLVGNIPENTKLEIISMMDVRIQQEVSVLQQEPYQSVTVSVILESTQQPPSTPPPPATQPPPENTKAEATQVPETKAVSSVAISDFAKPVIQESVTATVQTEIKTQLPTILPEAVSNVAAQMIQEALSKAPVVSTRSSAQPQSSYQAAEALTQFELKKILMEKMQRSQSYLTVDEHKNLYDALVLSYQLDKDLFDSYGQTISLKRSRDEDKDKDPSAGPDQGKEKKKRRTDKETESSKQSSKEPSTGKSHSSTYKSGKSTSTGKSAPREAQDVQLDMETTTSAGMSKADDEVSVDPKLKRSRPDWYPRSPTPEKPDPDWNTTKTIDDDEEQPWFKEMINAEKPPLTFDELMSRPIDFSAYALHHLKLPELTREILVGLVFNLLKGYDRPIDMTKPLPLQEKDGHLIIPIEVFFNNDREYLKGKNSERTYSTFVTPPKWVAAEYGLASVTS